VFFIDIICTRVDFLKLLGTPLFHISIQLRASWSTPTKTVIFRHGLNMGPLKLKTCWLVFSLQKKAKKMNMETEDHPFEKVFNIPSTFFGYHLRVFWRCMFFCAQVPRDGFAALLTCFSLMYYPTWYISEVIRINYTCNYTRFLLR